VVETSVNLGDTEIVVNGGEVDERADRIQGQLQGQRNGELGEAVEKIYAIFDGGGVPDLLKESGLDITFERQLDGAVHGSGVLLGSMVSAVCSSGCNVGLVNLVVIS
jgi:hypothetical protein